MRATPGPEPRRPAAALLAAALLCAATAGAAAQGPADPRLRQIERRLADIQDRDRLLVQDRTALQRELAGLREDLALAAMRLRDIERHLPALDARRAALAAEIDGVARDLAARRVRLGETALALARAARVSPEALVLAGRGPLDAARAGRLLAHALPFLDAEVRQLAARGETLEAGRARLAIEDAALAATRAELEAGRERLEEMIERRGRLVAALDGERAALALRAGLLGREATTRRDALQRAAEHARAEAQALAAARAAEAVAAALARPFAEALGRAHPPVLGRPVSGWGDTEGNGRIRRGISFATTPFATVVAPWHGTIAYAGPFRGYGAILIVESSDGYHWFIAGLDRLDVAHGQAVLAGEPVGRVGAAGRPDPTIYVELRRNGQPIDPGPWLAAPNGRMSG